MAFETIYNKVKKSNLIVFFDLEGTQIHHYPISIGLVAYEKKEGDIFFSVDKKIQYKAFINPKEEIGSVVEKITSITPELLEREGESFHEVVKKITTLLRPYHKCYISYGNLDIKMLSLGLNHHDETEMNFFRNVTKNYFDFHEYLFDRVVNEKGGAYSISKWMEILSLDMPGVAHDPLTDAICLSQIYQAFISDEDRAISLMLKNYHKNKNTSSYEKEVIQQLFAKKTITYEDFIEILKRHL